MTNKIDKETEEHKLFYENFLKFTTYTTVCIDITSCFVFCFMLFG